MKPKTPRKSRKKKAVDPLLIPNVIGPPDTGIFPEESSLEEALATFRTTGKINPVTISVGTPGMVDGTIIRGYWRVEVAKSYFRMSPVLIRAPGVQ